MGRKFLIFLVMLVHINGSMFLPQVAEVDVYNAQGQQEDDINTVIEYVEENILDNHQTNPEDEDNDQGQYFHLVKMVDYYYEIDFTPVRNKPVVAAIKNKFSHCPEEKITRVTLEILLPPPRA
ncbi:MAG: hypothetical protein QM726_11405 [Chitinophagaceae bacterium]